ncbi:hypothetical protein HDU85_004812 [Gaertneriomyces sp. JEL0708]|nr:hypothetical protein HDU85_004812 [Gaertneriomyces sp. JEL0708]
MKKSDSQATLNDSADGVEIVHVDKGQKYGDDVDVLKATYRRQNLISYRAGLSATTLTAMANAMTPSCPGRRPTWSPAMNILVKVIKANVEYRGHSVARARSQMEYPTPLPGSAKITPFKFQIDRNLLLQYERSARPHPKGFIVPDEAEGDDVYKLNGEWMEWKNKKTKAAPAKTERVVLYVHGGAYIMGSHKTHRLITYRLAKRCRAKVFVLNYRLAPEATFPAPIHDVFAAYLYLTQPDHPALAKLDKFPMHEAVDPSNIILIGDSAGGAISAAFCVYLKDFLRDANGEMMFKHVRGNVLISPFVDMTCSSQSWLDNYHSDILPGRPESMLATMFEGEKVEDPVNPVYSYLCGFGSNARNRDVFDTQARAGSARDEGDLEIEYEERNLEDLIGIGRPLSLTLYQKAAEVTGNIVVDLRRIPATDGRFRVSSEGRVMDPEVEPKIFGLALHPLASPLFADAHGMPPCLITNGDAEMIRDEGLLYAQRLAKANPHMLESGLLRHELYRDQPHVFQAIFVTKAAKASTRNIGAWVEHLFADADTITQDVHPEGCAPRGVIGVEDGLLTINSFLLNVDRIEPIVPVVHEDILEEVEKEDLSKNGGNGPNKAEGRFSVKSLLRRTTSLQFEVPEQEDMLPEPEDMRENGGNLKKAENRFSVKSLLRRTTSLQFEVPEPEDMCENDGSPKKAEKRFSVKDPKLAV